MDENGDHCSTHAVLETPATLPGTIPLNGSYFGLDATPHTMETLDQTGHFYYHHMYFPPDLCQQYPAAHSAHNYPNTAVAQIMSARCVDWATWQPSKKVISSGSGTTISVKKTRGPLLRLDGRGRIKCRNIQCVPSVKNRGIQEPQKGPNPRQANSRDISQRLLKLVSDPPVKSHELDQRHPFARLQPGLVTYGLERFERSTENLADGSDVDVTSLEGSALDDDDDDEWVMVSTSSSQFSCPYYRNNPVRHRRCLENAHLSSIFAVQRHLCRDHRQPAYCPICYEMFGTFTARDAHIRDMTCEKRDVTHIEGVNDERARLIAGVSARGGSAVKQWLDTSRVVLPAGEALGSPYLHGRLETRVARLRGFWDRYGENIVSDYVVGVWDGFRDWKCYAIISDEERSLAALYEATISSMVCQIMAEDTVGRTSCAE